MPAPVIVQFRAGGVSEIRRAFEAIENIAGRASNGDIRGTEKGARAASRAAADRERSAERQFRRLQTQTAKWVRDEAAAANKAQAAYMAADEARGRSAERLANRIRAAQQSAANAALTASAKAGAAWDKAFSKMGAANRRVASAERAAGGPVLGAMAYANAPRGSEEFRAANRASRMAGKDWDARFRLATAPNGPEGGITGTSAEDRALNRKMGRIQRQVASSEAAKTERAALRSFADRERFGQAFGRQIGTSASAALSSVARVGTSLLAVGGGFTAVDAVKEKLADEKVAVQIANSAHGGGRARPKMSAIMDRATAVSRSTGTDRDALLQGLYKYQQKSNDFEGGMANLQGFAKLAKASGASLSDVMETAGQLRFQQPDITADAMDEKMRNILAQGRIGAIDFPEMAKLASKMTASTSGYIGDKDVIGSQLMGLGQLAMRSTGGNGDEAATSINNLFSDLSKHRSRLKKAGLDVEDKVTGRMVNPEQLVGDIFEKTHGNLAKIQDLGVNKRAFRVFQSLGDTYNDAEAKVQGSGTSAVREEIHKFTSAHMSKEEVDSDYTAAMAVDGEALDKVFRDLKMDVGDALVPELRKMIPVLQQLAPAIVAALVGFAKFVAWFAANPLTGLGAVVSAKIAADLTQAGIGAVITKFIGTTFATMGGRGGGSTGSPATPLGAPIVGSGAMNFTGAVFSGAIMGVTIGNVLIEMANGSAKTKGRAMGDAEAALGNAVSTRGKSVDEMQSDLSNLNDAAKKNDAARGPSGWDLAMVPGAAVNSFFGRDDGLAELKEALNARNRVLEKEGEQLAAAIAKIRKDIADASPNGSFGAPQPVPKPGRFFPQTQ